MLVPASALAQTGITGTAHDLSSATGVSNVVHGSSAQICIYCHTPHSSFTQSLIWNHRATSQADGWTGMKTLAGTTLPNTLLLPSMRCLGCHDGSVAIGDVSNAGDGAPSQTLVGGTLDTDANGLLTNQGFMIGIGGNMGDDSGAHKGNHPVSIPYAGTTYNGVTSTALADGLIGNYYAVASSGCTSPSGFCTAGPTTLGRNGPSINLLGATAATVGVECTSCHEPHNKYGFDFFTRVDNAASGLCLSCHNK